MKYKFVLLKSSWGIVIYLDMDVLSSFEELHTDCKISSMIFLRLNEFPKLKKDVAEFWMGKAIEDLKEVIKNVSNGKKICFHVKSIDFSYVDFQVEGLYWATREWIGKFYKIDVGAIEVEFDEEKNRYIFPSLHYSFPENTHKRKST